MQDFIKYLESNNHTKSTQKVYLRYVDQFLQWYKQPVEQCTKKDIIKYLEHLKKHTKQQNQSRAKVHIALKHYFSYLTERNVITINPAALIKIRGTRRKTLYTIFTLEQLTTLHDDYYHSFIRNFDDSRIPLSTRYRSVLSYQRNYTMLGMIIYQGLTTRELHELIPDDIDLIKATVLIKGSRKSNERKLPLKAEQIGSLMNYIQNVLPQFLEHNKTGSDRLFSPLPENNTSNRYNEKLHGTLQILIRQLKSISTGIVNFKQIRASVITNWLKTEGLRKTQYLAGHRYISSTEGYLPNDLESLTDDIAKFNPF